MWAFSDFVGLLPASDMLAHKRISWAPDVREHQRTGGARSSCKHHRRTEVGRYLFKIGLKKFQKALYDQDLHELDHLRRVLRGAGHWAPGLRRFTSFRAPCAGT